MLALEGGNGAKNTNFGLIPSLLERRNRMNWLFLKFVAVIKILILLLK